jgi:predicted Zn-dependent peptidase
MPFVQTLILVYAATLELKDTQITIVDQDDSAFSQELISKFEKHFKDIHRRNRDYSRTPFTDFNPIKKIVKKHTYQTHCIIGGKSYKLKNEKRAQFLLLNNLLGGPNMNSRLNLSLREKHGLAYNIESFYNPYEDTGIFGIYFGTDNGNLNKSIDIINKELNKLKNTPLGTLQLHKAKKQLIGQIAIASESYSNLMLNIGKSFLQFDKVDTIDEIAAKIEKISSNNIIDAARENFNTDQFFTLVFE